MEESDLKNPVWQNLVLKKVKVDLNFLAAKVLLSRLQMTLYNNSSIEEVEKAKKEIFHLYFKNKDLPNAKKDIGLLLNKYSKN